MSICPCKARYLFCTAGSYPHAQLYIQPPEQERGTHGLYQPCSPTRSTRTEARQGSADTEQWDGCLDHRSVSIVCMTENDSMTGAGMQLQERVSKQER